MRHFCRFGAGVAALTPALACAQQAPATPPPPGPEIVVTGSAFGTDTASVVAKVDRNAILESGGASIADTLSSIPGVSATSFAAGSSRPIIRGMDATRVRMLEDGSSSSDVSDIGPDHGVPIDPLAAQSIEVIRGAATLRYGSQAIGGVVNVLNNRVPQSLPARPVAAEFNASYGSVSDTTELSGLVDAKVGDVALHADGFVRDAGDYDTPLGVQANSRFHGSGGSVGGSFVSGDSHAGAAVIRYDANYGIPSGDSHIVMRQTKAITRDTIVLGDGALKSLDLVGSYAGYRHDEVEPDGSIATTFRNKEADLRAELAFGRLGALDGTSAGVELLRRRFSAVGEDGSYLFPTLTQSEAGYVFTELPLGGGLRLQASGRVEHLRLDGTPSTDRFTRTDFTPVSGAVGAILEATPTLKLGLTLSSTGRAPAQTELFARGGHDGPNTFETGDPGLGIERADSVEATVRLHADRVRFEGSVYSSWFHHYVFGDLTGRTCDEDGACLAGEGRPLRELLYRQANAHFRGLEGQASFDLARGTAGTLSLSALGDYTRATLEHGDNVPRIPPYRLGGGLAWKSRPADASIQATYVGRQDKFGAFDTPTPHYWQLAAQAAVRPFPSHQGVELAIAGQNLLNDVQRAATSLNKDEVVLPGRNVRLVLRVATF